MTQTTKKIMQNKQGNRISLTVMSVKTKELNEKATKNKKKDDAKEEKREIILAATLIISLEKEIWCKIHPEHLK